jgi:hypothetical protein
MVLASQLMQRFREESDSLDAEGRLRETTFLLRFNRWLEGELRTLVVQAPGRAEACAPLGGAETLAGPLIPTRNRPFMLALARLLHAPYYLPLRALARRLCQGTVHYDAVLFAILMLTYPLFLGTLALLLGCAFGWIGALGVVLWPATAWFSRFASTNPSV